MSKIRAKFRVHNVSPQEAPNTDGGKTKYAERVQMSPVYSDDKTSENYSFSQYTPSGHIEMTITNPAAFGAFVEGQEVYIDFTPAVSAEAPKPESESYIGNGYE